MTRRTPRPIGDLLADAVPQLSESLVEYRVRKAWSALVGPDTARRARPATLAGGCLTVVVDNSPWLTELTLRASELTARLAAEFPVVTSLRFTLGPRAVEAPPATGRPPTPAALTADERREIDAAAAVIPDPAAAEAARRLLAAARRAARR
jgi:hypothetical protein